MLAQLGRNRNIPDSRKVSLNVKLKAILLVVMMMLTTAACGGSNTASDGTLENPLVGQYQTTSGEVIDLASFAGQDVVFWFWAPW